MTGYETDPVTIADERRRYPGIALISHRQTALAARLVGATVPHRHVSPPTRGAADLLYGVRPPVLLDAQGMPAPELVDLLCEVANARRPMTTVVMARPENILAQRLAAACPVVPVLIAESVEDRVLRAWLRQSTNLALRASPEIPPAMVGLRAPMRDVPLNLTVLQILRALQPAYQFAPETMDAAAMRSSFSRRMFFYHLSALRSALQIDHERRYRPEDLASLILARLSE
jgi:hypothetical protein